MLINKGATLLFVHPFCSRSILTHMYCMSYRFRYRGKGGQTLIYKGQKVTCLLQNHEGFRVEMSCYFQNSRCHQSCKEGSCQQSTTRLYIWSRRFLVSSEHDAWWICRLISWRNPFCAALHEAVAQQHTSCSVRASQAAGISHLHLS